MGLCLESAFNPKAHYATDCLLVVVPEHIDTLMRDGYTKAMLRERIQAVTARPLTELAADDRSAVGIAVDKLAQLDPEKQQRLVPKFASTDNIHLVVAGGDAGKFSAAFHGWLTGPMGSTVVSRKIEE